MQKIRQYVGIENSMAVVDVKGKYVLDITDKVRSELEEAYRRGCTSVRFEMGGTDYIDSTVNKLIIRTTRRVGEANVEITNPKGLVVEQLTTVALDRYIKNGGRQA